MSRHKPTHFRNVKSRRWKVKGKSFFVVRLSLFVYWGLEDMNGSSLLPLSIFHVPQKQRMSGH